MAEDTAVDNLRKYFAEQDAALPKSERLEAAILAMIGAGMLESGAALPPQREMADKLGMALSMVTKTCNNLKKRGILYGERGRGSFVAFNRQFAHDIGDRFSLDESYLREEDTPDAPDAPVLCNLVERLKFLNEPLPQTLDFGQDGQKYKTLKEYGAEYLRQAGVHVHARDVALSHNAYVALWTAFSLCCPAGAVLGAPALSFLPLFRNRLVADNVRLVPLECDQYGILPEALEAACKASHLTVLTCSPECELPTTNRMGRQRRQEIADLARKYDFTIIENNWLLPNGKEPEIPALAMFAPERAIFLEHGTKMLSCENFCSFSYVPAHLCEKFIYQRNMMAGPLSLLSRKISQFWLESGRAQRDYQIKSNEILKRNELAREILEPAPVKIHKYARFCWLPLGKGQSGSAMRQQLLRQGVLVSCARHYLIGSVCREDGLLVGLGHEPCRERLEKALLIIRNEILK